MIWSSHSQYGLYHQSSRFRPQTIQDALIAQRLEEAADEIQTQYWKSLYPEKIKKIQQEIEHTCDELDYAGSFIYDEYPDKINLNRTLNLNRFYFMFDIDYSPVQRHFLIYYCLLEINTHKKK